LRGTAGGGKENEENDVKQRNPAKNIDQGKKTFSYAPHSYKLIRRNEKRQDRYSKAASFPHLRDHPQREMGII
jgi:hypothetical protein